MQLIIKEKKGKHARLHFLILHLENSINAIFKNCFKCATKQQFHNKSTVMYLPAEVKSHGSDRI